MRDLIEKMKAKASRAWARVKAWVYGLLVTLGVVAGAMAAFGTASWTNPTQNTDGSAFNAATEQAEVRLYCEVDPSQFVPQKPADVNGAARASSHTPDHVEQGDATNARWQRSPAGTFDCFATVLSIYGYESDPSNVAAITFTPIVAPEAITDFGQ